MTTFTVDSATLQELSSTLSGIHSEMQNMHGVTTGYEGLLGGSDLEGEVAHFCSRWNYGMGKLGVRLRPQASGRATWTSSKPPGSTR
jgi:hypothetical protein